MVYQRLVQIVSGWVALCHVTLGVAGLFADAPLMGWLIRTFYGAEMNIDATLFYVIKLLSVYFIAFGLLAAVITARPRRFVGLVPIVVGFFVLRLGELIYFYSFVGEQFQVPDGRLVEKIVSFSLIALLLAFSTYKLRTSDSSPLPQAR